MGAIIICTAGFFLGMYISKVLAKKKDKIESTQRSISEWFSTRKTKFREWVRQNVH